VHLLRVRALGASGAVSRVVRVSVRVVPSLPARQVGSPIAVGPGAGVPTVSNGAVWVPTTGDGGLVKVVGGAVAFRTQVGPRLLSGEGYLDAPVAGGGALWSASDIGSTIARVDPASGAATTFTVPERPGGLTEGGGAVWAFHFLQQAISRIDEAHGTATRLDAAGASGVGLAYGGGSLWLLSLRPNRILELDPANGAVRRTIALSPRLTRRPSLGQPFGIAVGGGSAWVATDRGVVRLDGGTGAPVDAAYLPPTLTTAFVSVAYGDGAAWVTNFDRGTLSRVDDPAAP
jgi:streptogramin lyase